MHFDVGNVSINAGCGAVFSAVLCAVIANMRGRNVVGWFVLGFFLPMISLIVLLILPNNQAPPMPAPESVPAPPTAAFGAARPDAAAAFRQVVWHAEMRRVAQGPFNFDDLRGLWRKGRIAADSLVWTRGMAGWRRVRDVPGLLGALGDVSA